MEFSFATSAPLSLLTALVVGGVTLKAAGAGAYPALKTSAGTVITGDATVARALARGGKLLGADSTSQAEVDEWLEAVAVFGPSLLQRLNDALASRTYLAGYALSLADLAVYLLARAHGIAEDHTNSVRWFNTISAAVPVEELEKHVGSAAKAPVAASRQQSTGSAVTASSAASSKRPDTVAAEAPKQGAGAAAEKPGKGDPARAEAGKAKAEAAKAAVAAARDAKVDAAAKAQAGKAKTDAAKAASGTGKNIGGGGEMGSMPLLEGAEMGQVVTRFPPEPSGYLHIGHVKALLLNDYYAKAYNGKMILRFDDTNPSKEKEEYKENISKDLIALGVKFVSTSHTSDHFELIETYARKLIAEGKAFMDDTPREEMQRQRTALEDSPRRNATISENTARFDLMMAAGPEGSKWCLRAKMNMQDPNGTCRDPVLYRCNDTPHPRTGTKYRAYPTYDLACPIVDSIEGVTHALRSSEYHDRDVQYYRLLEMMGLRKVIIQDFSRLNFIYTLLSKRKLNWFVENKLVDGWFDARFPTVQGILRRGCTVPALREFILGLGASRRDVEMEWDKFWSINKKHIDPVAPRYTALPKDGLVSVQLTNGPAAPEYRTHPLHPKNPAVGVKTLLYTPSVLLDVADVAEMKENEEITLMKWGNAFIRKIVKDAAGKIVSAVAELNPGGDFKKTEKKVTWLPDSPENISITMSEFDYLIKVPNLLEGDNFEAAINPVTKLDTILVGEPAMRLMQPNDIIQVERRAFFRCDRAYLSEDRPAILFSIPDGRVKGLFNLGDRVKTATKA